MTVQKGNWWICNNKIFIPQRNIDNNDRQSDERYQINIIDEKQYEERDKIGENREETLNTDIEVLKLRKLISQKKKSILRNNMIK